MYIATDNGQVAGSGDCLHVHSKLSPLQLPERRGLQQCNNTTPVLVPAWRPTCPVTPRDRFVGSDRASCGNAIRYDAPRHPEHRFSGGLRVVVADRPRSSTVREGTRGRGRSRAAGPVVITLCSEIDASSVRSCSGGGNGCAALGCVALHWPAGLQSSVAVVCGGSCVVLQCDHVRCLEMAERCAHAHKKASQLRAADVSRAEFTARSCVGHSLWVFYSAARTSRHWPDRISMIESSSTGTPCTYSQPYCGLALQSVHRLTRVPVHRQARRGCSAGASECSRI